MTIILIIHIMAITCHGDCDDGDDDGDADDELDDDNNNVYFSHLFPTLCNWRR